MFLPSSQRWWAVCEFLQINRLMLTTKGQGFTLCQVPTSLIFKVHFHIVGRLSGIANSSLLLIKLIKLIIDLSFLYWRWGWRVIYSGERYVSNYADFEQKSHRPASGVLGLQFGLNTRKYIVHWTFEIKVLYNLDGFLDRQIVKKFGTFPQPKAKNLLYLLIYKSYAN